MLRTAPEIRRLLRSSPRRRPRLTERPRPVLLNECLRRRPPCQTEWPCLCGRGVPGGRGADTSAQSLSTLRAACKMRLHAVLFCLVFQFPSGLPFPQGKCLHSLLPCFTLCKFWVSFRTDDPGRGRSLGFY